MKKLITLFLLCGISFNIYAQKKTAHSFGMMVVPMMGIDLDKPEQGITNYSTAFAVLNLDWKKAGVNVMYSAKNQIAVAHYRSITDNVGWYVLANKNIMVDQNYLGTGLYHGVPGTKASVFAEFGSSYTSWTPGGYFGVLFPLYFRIK